MSWISLSATSLLDTQYGYSVPISMDLSVLHAHLSDLSWYSQVQLSKNLRSTGQIGSCAAPGQVEKYSGYSTYTPTSVLPPLVANTVPGVRPHLTMTAWSTSYPADYDAIQQGVLHSLTTLLHLPTPVTSHHVAILCGNHISPRQVATLLTSHPTTLYDAGVEQYEYDGTPAYYQPGESDLTTQREQVIQWLTGQGGVLVTSSHLYNGLEADFVIFVTRNLSRDRGTRSNLLRAVGGLCVVADSDRVNKKAVKKYFIIHTFPA